MSGEQSIARLEPHRTVTTEPKNDDLNLLALTNCTGTTSSREVDRVGPYSTTKVDHESECPGAAHPYGSELYMTTNTRSGFHVDLKDIFPKEEIYSALMKNDVVQQALKSVGKDPKSYEELEKALSEDELGIHVTSGDKDIYLNKNILSNFAFRKFENGVVDTAVLPDYGSEATRNCDRLMDIYLPVPPQMKKDFEDADAKKDGAFLMKDSMFQSREVTAQREFGQIPTREDLLNEFNRNQHPNDEYARSVENQIQSLSDDDLKLISKLTDDAQMSDDRGTPFFNLLELGSLEYDRRLYSGSPGTESRGKPATIANLTEQFNKEGHSFYFASERNRELMLDFINRTSATDLEIAGKIASSMQETWNSGNPGYLNLEQLTFLEQNRRYKTYSS